MTYPYNATATALDSQPHASVEPHYGAPIFLWHSALERPLQDARNADGIYLVRNTEQRVLDVLVMRNRGYNTPVKFNEYAFLGSADTHAVDTLYPQWVTLR